MQFSNAQQLRQAFEEVYTDIFKTRFWGLPIANHHLTVQVVGLRETDDFYSFSLVTPWMLNQVAVPKREDVDARAVEGMRLDNLERLGDFYVINAISPMDIFGNMAMDIEEGGKLSEQIFARLSNVAD